MDHIFGFIGAGNMGTALAGAVRKSVSGEQILISNRTPQKAAALAADLGCLATDNLNVARDAQYIFLGVKPQMLADLFSEIAPILQARKTPFVLISMAAGVTMDKICALSGLDCAVLRIMPNTPCAIGKGVLLYTPNALLSPEDLDILLHVLEASGTLVPLSEHLFDAGSAIAGCGPAFADLFIEALADGGVACGLPRNTAIQLASGMLSGSADLQMQTKKHPGILKDQVCSPGGSTIQGVRALEQNGFRSAVFEAVIAAYERTRQLG